MLRTGRMLARCFGDPRRRHGDTDEKADPGANPRPRCECATGTCRSFEESTDCAEDDACGCPDDGLVPPDDGDDDEGEQQTDDHSAQRPGEGSPPLRSRVCARRSGKGARRQRWRAHERVWWPRTGRLPTEHGERGNEDTNYPYFPPQSPHGEMLPPLVGPPEKAPLPLSPAVDQA